MNEPLLMCGSDWDGQDVSGWWLSEKLDGWRCLWTCGQFFTRSGEPLDAPGWFRAGLPQMPLDGELWAGPGTTHRRVNSLVRSRSWDSLRFCPFDVPLPGVRIEMAQEAIRRVSLPAHVQPVEYRRLVSTRQALAAMRGIVAGGGEGAMVRKPRSCYFVGHRSYSLLKLKPSRPR